MNTLGPTPDYAYPPCPSCGKPARHELVRKDRLGITTGYYVCPDEHLWSTRWCEDQPLAG